MFTMTDTVPSMDQMWFPDSATPPSLAVHLTFHRFCAAKQSAASQGVLNRKRESANKESV